MSFRLKALVAVLLTGSLLVLGIGCGLNIGDEKEKETPVKLDARGFHCVTHIRENLDGYFRAEFTSKETGEFYDCLKRAFTQFQSYTRGADRDSYQPEELRRFLENNFLKPGAISDPLLRESVNLKVMLLGGTTDKITRAEFTKLNDVLDIFKAASIQMQPYLRALNTRVGIGAIPEYRQRLSEARAASEATIRVAQYLGQQLGEKINSYPLVQMQEFLVELARFIYGSDTDSAIKARRWADLLGIFKTVTTGGARDVVEPQEWGTLLQAGFGWYSFYIRFHYENGDGSLIYGPGLEDFVDNVGRAIHLIELAINRQTEKVLKFEDLEQLAYRMKALGLMPAKFSASGVSQSLRPVIDRILGDTQVKPKKRSSAGLNLYALNQAKSEFYRWADIQIYLDRSFSPAQQAQSVDLAMKVLGAPSPAGLRIDPAPLGIKFFTSGAEHIVSQELENIRRLVRPLFKVNSSKVVLAPIEELGELDVYHGFYNLSVMNVVRGLVRILIRGYAEEQSRVSQMQGLTDEEMTHFFRDVKELGRDLHFIDPRNVPGLGGRAFTEGNVFTFNGNGLQRPNPDNPTAHLLNFEEGLELVSLIYSGGNLNDELYHLGLKACPKGSIDVFGRPKVDRECFRKKALAELSSHLVGLPHMKRFWDSLDRSGRAEAYAILENIVVRPLQDETEYQEVATTLDDTKPMATCSSPNFARFRPGARKAYQACLENNERRLPLLDTVIKELREKEMNPVHCPWVRSKEVSKNYCQWIESGEIGSIAVIIHYVETIMTRFDTNRNDHMETDEAWVAFPVFRGLIGKLARAGGHDLDDGDLQDVYGYILSNRGSIPSGGAGVVWSKALSGFSWSINLNRMDLLRIFGTITDGGQRLPSAPRERELWDQQQTSSDENQLIMPMELPN